MIPTRFSAVERATLDAAPAAPASLTRGDDAPPFARGFIGVLGYDDLLPASFPRPAAPLSRIFRVEESICIDHQRSLLYRSTAADAATQYSVDINDLKFSEPPTALAPPGSAAAASGLALAPLAADGAYLAAVAAILADISSGRFYQLNLLRYFTVAQAPTPAWIAGRLDQLGGAFSAWLRLPDLEIVSFSPERFLRGRLAAGTDAGWLEACPIKGTIARVPGSPERDAAAGRALLSSRKDLAELHMIVDLMRNDLHQVAQQGSVVVLSPGHLLSASNVHHLEATVRARPRADLRFGDLLRALCPAGSVTGAPKREVMQAIRTYEGRERGYFMGHIFYLGDDGTFDASLLIRTLVRQGPRGTRPWEFAAGSGIVSHSEPSSELAEIDAKSRLVTAGLRPIGSGDEPGLAELHWT